MLNEGGINMDHSLRGYLMRRSTAVLEMILRTYDMDDLTPYEASVVQMVKEILQQRKETENH